MGSDGLVRGSESLVGGNGGCVIGGEGRVVGGGTRGVRFVPLSQASTPTMDLLDFSAYSNERTRQKLTYRVP